MVRLTASLVVYETPVADLLLLFQTLQQSTSHWIVIDNSVGEPEASRLRQDAVQSIGGIYVDAGSNLGFGAGHNLALRYFAEHSIDSRYHLIVNPDIEFDPGLLERLADLLDSEPEVGWVMPQVRYTNGQIQPLAKLLPSPLDLFGRRFLPGFGRRLLQRRQDTYELRGGEFTATTTVPFLSGCFIFARRDMLDEAGGFDERYFMYMEDVDLCRRFAARSKLLYWPEAFVVHGYKRGSHHSFGLTLRHIQSAIRYFERWGWWFDPERVRLNRKALESLEQRSRPIPEHHPSERFI